jgi:hypothetical protein
MHSCSNQNKKLNPPLHPPSSSSCSAAIRTSNSWLDANSAVILHPIPNRGGAHCFSPPLALDRSTSLLLLLFSFRSGIPLAKAPSIRFLKKSSIDWSLSEFVSLDISPGLSRRYDSMALVVTDEVALPIRAVGDLAAAAEVPREEVAIITQCPTYPKLTVRLGLPVPTGCGPLDGGGKTGRELRREIHGPLSPAALHVRHQFFFRSPSSCSSRGFESKSAPHLGRFQRPISYSFSSGPPRRPLGRHSQRVLYSGTFSGPLCSTYAVGCCSLLLVLSVL